MTAPEIEMLMIHATGLYTEYKKTHQKPSVFLAQQLHKKTALLKRHDFIRAFFAKHDLKEAIYAHKSKSTITKGYVFLVDILN